VLDPTSSRRLKLLKGFFLNVRVGWANSQIGIPWSVNTILLCLHMGTISIVHHRAGQPGQGTADNGEDQQGAYCAVYVNSEEWCGKGTVWSSKPKGWASGKSKLWNTLSTYSKRREESKRANPNSENIFWLMHADSNYLKFVIEFHQPKQTQISNHPSLSNPTIRANLFNFSTSPKHHIPSPTLPSWYSCS
jgi:hypothetical protein